MCLLCLCCYLCCCLWLLLLFVVAIYQFLVLLGLEGVSRKRNVLEIQFLELFNLFLVFWRFWKLFHFQKNNLKIEKMYKVVKEEVRVVWLFDHLSKTFLSLILVLVNISVGMDPKSLIVTQKVLPLKQV